MEKSPLVLSLILKQATILLLWLVVSMSDPQVGRAGILTDPEKNLLTLTEAGAMTTSMLNLEFGPVPATLPFSGTFGPSAWTLALTGTYAGMAVALSFNASFDQILNAGSFTSAGTIGTSNWSGSGNWSFSDVTFNVTDLSFASTATIRPLSGPVLKPDTEQTVPKKEVTTDDDKTRHTVSQGEYFDTEADKRVGKEHDQTDDSIGPSGGSTVVVTVNLVDENTVLLGTGDFSSGTINGEITVTPEPRSLLLLMTAIFGCASYRIWPRLARLTRPRARLALLTRQH